MIFNKTGFILIKWYVVHPNNIIKLLLIEKTAKTVWFNEKLMITIEEV